MKKILTTIFLLVAYVTANAQLDTVRYGDQCYLFKPYDTLDAYFSGDDYGTVGLYLIPYAVHSATDIYGIAATVEVDVDDTGGYQLYPDSSIAVGLFQIIDGQLILADSAFYTHEMQRCLFEYKAGSSQYNTDVITKPKDCFEFLFEQPHTVYDTFYISYVYTYNPASLESVHWTLYSRDHTYSLKTRGGINNEYVDKRTLRHYNMLAWGGQFPMLQPDRLTCRKVTGLHVVESGADWATLGWNGGDCDHYKIILYSHLDTTYETVDTTLTLSGLQPGITYSAWARRVCHHSCRYHDTVLVGPSSARLDFQVGNNGIIVVDKYDMTLSPNPTSDEVTVSAEGIEGEVTVSVVDMAGVEVYRREGTRLPLTLGTAAWPTGTYLVRLTTPQGVATKKLTVAR